jgi:hypothetical protein
MVRELKKFGKHCPGCTRVENPEEGLPEIFAKISRGSRLSGKVARGVLFRLL